MPLGNLSNYSIATLATLRMVVGGVTLLVPTHAAPLFGVTLTPHTTILARLFGVRDFIIGAYLWNVREQYMKISSGDKTMGEVGLAMNEAAKRELKRVLWMGIITDAVDVGSCLIGWMDGSMQVHALMGCGVGAAVFLEMGLLGLRACRIMV